MKIILRNTSLVFESANKNEEIAATARYTGAGFASPTVFYINKNAPTMSVAIFDCNGIDSVIMDSPNLYKGFVFAVFYNMSASEFINATTQQQKDAAIIESKILAEDGERIGSSNYYKLNKEISVPDGAKCFAIQMTTNDTSATVNDIKAFKLA